ncbi:succinylglutamate desuccinylase/aspartoacylase family protein [Mesorhizobium sp. BR1-1-13]|uniref:succinylglutamate desuccinylase/aspartoacylase family protein n=1 Tax=Mesorhizobium sp. BR1-1-13 TaxID=2876656 RepID=UPI001CD0D3D7|nr:succinylglutamate desuccinylase/aspartoacylase family protein [Mesorhizobium sp. BR1-1-13]MBZ9942416.1 succinylglutamate desuccinylase/aspartoacylase family protein [Mesorhizobium sp. BR1-1-13]
MTGQTRIWTPIDYDADGKQSDCLRLPHSTDLSAYGWVPIPLACIKNGSGPTALLIAGNHGDEYEGQIALCKLAREIRHDQVSGRLIILPGLNSPAVAAGRRVSPLDEGNLNRSFPGDAAGSPTQMIAHYVCQVLIPMADIVVDLHSGGRSLDYAVSALVRPGRTVEEHEKLLRLLRLFGAPISFVSDGTGGGGLTTLAAAAQQQGALVLTTELGGGATLRKEGLALAEAGLKRILKDQGILRDLATQPASPTRFMTVKGHDAFVYAHSRGIFEPAADIGDEVVGGQIAGHIHFPDLPTREPETLFFATSGLVACRRAPSLTERGDCLFKVMEDIDIGPDRASHA